MVKMNYFLQINDELDAGAEKYPHGMGYVADFVEVEAILLPKFIDLKKNLVRNFKLYRNTT